EGILMNEHLSPLQHYQGLYNLTLMRQLTHTSVTFSLSWQPESNAVVKVRGPLDHPDEKEVTFVSEGNGVYGDQNFELPRMACRHYKLEIKPPDGRSYTSTTYIPDSVH